jgi:hypothetical protein
VRLRRCHVGRDDGCVRGRRARWRAVLRGLRGVTPAPFPLWPAHSFSALPTCPCVSAACDARHPWQPRPPPCPQNTHTHTNAAGGAAPPADSACLAAVLSGCGQHPSLAAAAAQQALKAAVQQHHAAGDQQLVSAGESCVAARWPVRPRTPPATHMPRCQHESQPRPPTTARHADACCVGSSV